MPADFSIDAQRRIVFSRAEGVLTVAEILDNSDRMRRDPEFRPDFNQLFDLRGVTKFELSNEDIEQLARQLIFAPESRRAFLVTPGLQVGMARMFATYRTIAGGEHGIRIFTDPGEARSWVSLPGET